MLLGISGGAAAALVLALALFGPASQEMRRGYFNALVTGLLLAAAIEVIPNALDAVELAGRQLVELLAPPQANDKTAKKGALSALPLEATDYVGLAVVVVGLAGYALWWGLARGLASSAAGALDVTLLLPTFSAALLGIAGLGLVENLRAQWWLLPVGSIVIGLAPGLGSLWKGEQLALEAGLLPLVIAGGCLVYGIGRLLRLLQHEIGLGWQTTLTVAVGALLLYQGRALL
jgi:hypothetical protein